MSKVEEIEDAIRSLPAEEREQLIRRLPSILPELDGDAAWERIIRDPRPRPALEALGHEIEAQLQKNPQAFPEMTENM